MKNKILEVSNLQKSYYTLHGEVMAIKDISFNLNENEFLVLVGTSGCGKSTLLNILAGIDKQTDGKVKYKDGIKIGYMLQTDCLLPWKNVLDNALLGLKIKKICTKDNINYVKNLLVKYGLKDFIYKYPNELSGGMKQRVH